MNSKHFEKRLALWMMTASAGIILSMRIGLPQPHQHLLFCEVHTPLSPIISLLSLGDLIKRSSYHHQHLLICEDQPQHQHQHQNASSFLSMRITLPHHHHQPPISHCCYCTHPLLCLVLGAFWPKSWSGTILQQLSLKSYNFVANFHLKLIDRKVTWAATCHSSIRNSKLASAYSVYKFRQHIFRV